MAQVTYVTYIGLTGEGKSYEVVNSEILPAIRCGRQVITNMPLLVDELARDYPQAVSLVKLLTKESCGGAIPFSWIDHYPGDNCWRHPDQPGMGPLVVIDEAYYPLPKHGKGTVPAEVGEWHKHHRHYGCRVVLVTQGFDDIDKNIRELSRRVYSMKNDFLPGSAARHRYIKRHYYGPYGPPTKPDKKERLTRDLRVFEYYESHSRGGGLYEDPTETDQQAKPKPLWRQRKWQMVAAGLVLFGLAKMLSVPAATTARVVTAAEMAPAPISTTTVAAPVATSAPGRRHPLAGRRLDIAVIGLWSTGESWPLVYVDGRKTHPAALEAMGYRVQMVNEYAALLTWSGSDEVWSLEVGVQALL